MSFNQDIILQVEKYCSDNDIRLTDKRKYVLLSLIEASKALSAYELIDILRDKYNINIQSMSLYRILNFLDKEKLIHKLQLTSKYIICSHVKCPYEHQFSQFLICEKCGSVKEIMISQSLVDHLKTTITEAGYYFSSSQVELNCLCKECAKN